MGQDEQVFWGLLALVGVFVAVFGLLLWLRLARQWRGERRSEADRADVE